MLRINICSIKYNDLLTNKQYMLTGNCGGFYISQKSQIFGLEDIIDASEDAPSLLSKHHDKKICRMFFTIGQDNLTSNDGKVRPKLKRDVSS